VCVSPTAGVKHPRSAEPRTDAGEVYISVDDPEYQAEEAEHEGRCDVAERQRVGRRRGLTTRCLEN